MKKSRLIYLLLTLLTVCMLQINCVAQSKQVNKAKADTTAATTQNWDAARTWVLVVGLLEWKREDYFNPFPKTNRKDAVLVNSFRNKGVPNSHILYIQDQAGTLKNIEEGMANFLPKAKPGDTLFFYFCGHGYKEDYNAKDAPVYFACYDAYDWGVKGWRVDKIIPAIDKYFPGSQVMLTADCCYSGALAQCVNKYSGRLNLTALASSTDKETSTENWTFTECLVNGFNGEPFVDANKDGIITIAELANHTKKDMTLVEKQEAAFAVNNNDENDNVIAKTSKQNSSKVNDLKVGKHIDVEWHGKWYPSSILAISGNRYKIHYDGYGNEYDEWVTYSRMRESKN